MNELVRFTARGAVGKIDRKNGIVHGVSVITGHREASGHGVYIDDVMLDQVLAAGQAKEPTGVKSRFDHPTACSRAMGTFIGRMHNFRRDGNVVRSDLHVSGAAAVSPDGDLREYVLDLAEEDPAAFGASIVFAPDEPETLLLGPEVPEDSPVRLPHARLKALHQCDVVDDAAANDGIFGRPNYWAEQAEKMAMAILPKVMDRYFEAKRQKLERDEEMKELEMATAQLKARDAEITELKAKLAAGPTPDEIRTSAIATARAEDLAWFAKRLKAHPDTAFLASTMGKTDDETATAWAAELAQKAAIAGAATGAAPAGTAANAAASEPGTPNARAAWDAVVRRTMDEKKITRGAAVRLATKKFPAEYEAFRNAL